MAFFLVSLVSCHPHFIGAGSGSINPALHELCIIAGDGTLLPLRKWLPPEPPVAVILALHGFNDYSNFIDAGGQFLAARDIAVYAYDQRGFGEAPNRGHWPGVATLVDDLRTATSLLRDRHPSIPLYILGESMGGAIAMVAAAGANPPEAKGLILVAPAVWHRRTMPFYQRWLMWLGAHLLPGLTVTGESLDIKPSDNIEMLRALGKDSLVIRGTRLDTIYGLGDLMDQAYVAAEAVKFPSIYLYGEKDEIIPRKPTVVTMKKMMEGSVQGSRFILYPEGYHMLLRDLQRETALRDIVAWIGGESLPPSILSGEGNLMAFE